MENNLKNKKWLVTGAAGFLGSHAVECLLNQGLSVVALDDLSWGHKKNIEMFEKNKNFTFIKQDIRKEKEVLKIFQDQQFSAVVHLAALHFIPDAIKNPSLTLDINVLGTQNLLTAASSTDVNNFWFASTGDVYAPDKQPHKEESLVAPFNIYGMSKFLGENLIKLQSKINPKMKFFIGRLFNLYGTRETNPHILPEVIKQLKSAPNAALKLGNIWPKRDLVPVEDAAKVIFDSLSKVDPGVTTMNVASGVAISIEEVLGVIGDLRNKKIEIINDPSRVRPVERDHLQADVSKLKKFIGWTPHTDLKKHLANLLKVEGIIN